MLGLHGVCLDWREGVCFDCMECCVLTFKKISESQPSHTPYNGRGFSPLRRFLFSINLLTVK